ncbi:MAG: DUF423 domain-containing protein [Sphingobium sp.]
MTLFVLAALSAAVAIAAGAFGAHGAAPKAAEYLRTGGLYQMVHAVAVIAIAAQMRGPATCLLIGAAVFAFTLYGIALGGPTWLGAITPVGGSLMIAGWVWAAWAFSRG